MKTNLKQPLLKFINSILTFKGWQNIGEPLIFMGDAKDASYDLDDYFDDSSVLKEAMENENHTLLLETLSSYDTAIEDDWLPDLIEGLPIPKACLFLQEIKNILQENIPDSKIEKELIKRYNQNVPSNYPN